MQPRRSASSRRTDIVRSMESLEAALGLPMIERSSYTAVEEMQSHMPQQ